MRIAIVAHNAYGMISSTGAGHIGGVERQTAMLARWLAGRRHDITLITWDEGGAPVETIDGIRVVKVCRADAGLPGVRFFVPRWSSLNRALAVADAEICYQNGAEEVTGQVALWCRRHGRRFVFSAASDIDCRNWLTSEPALRERLLYRYGLRAADRIVVQTNVQARLLKEAIGLEGRVLPMPGDDFERICGEDEAGADDRKPLLLMVGRIAPEKNIELFVETARALPHMRFLVVGPAAPGHRYFESLATRAAGLDNFEFFGAAGRQELCRLYRQATALCCTSHYEGFPNTFIEAWSLGLPVVSTVDPDGVITKYGLGAHVSGADELRERIIRIAGSAERREAIAGNARRYFASHHQRDVAMERFESLFREMT
jgi:glycosyltransferase involved in cell wall biosynthesis